MTTLTNPFDVLPANLFNVFSTQGQGNLQRHYMAILLRIYALAEFNRFGLTRDVVIAEIVNYLATEGAAAEIESELGAGTLSGAGGREDDETEEATSHPSEVALPERNGKEAHSSTQDQASYLLRRLLEVGWLEREQHADYTEYIILPDYAFTLLEALRAIQERKPREYTGQLYTAYQLLTSQTDDFAPALALTQAYENVRQVVRGLNELNQNIRRYSDRVTRDMDVADLLRLQYDDYAQILGPAYHALKTSDHVSRYRRDIIGQLQAWQLDGDWLDAAADELATQGRFTPAQAADEINHYLRFIVHQLESLDPLLNEIDQRHAQYLRTSLRHVRYKLVSANGGFKDRLVFLAGQLAAMQDTGEQWLPEAMPGFLSAPVRQPDCNSFYTLPQRSAPFTPTLVVEPILGLSELASLRAITLQEVGAAITPDKIQRFVHRFLNGHRAIHVSELPPDAFEDFPWLIYAIAYSHHPEVDYGLEVTPGEPVELGPYRVMPFRLVKL